MMAIDDIFIGFTISYLAGLNPSLKGLKEGGKSLQDLIDNCYEKALKRWSADNVIRKRIAQYKFSSVEQLRELYKTNKWTEDAQSLKELADLWADELRKDEVCAHYIQEKGIHEINDKIDKIIYLLTAPDRYRNPQNQYRGLKTHNAINGYIRRYCSSEKSESNFMNYLLDNKERHILADYVVGNVDNSSTNKYILYSSAQTGKTTELKQLCWELQQSGLFLPVLLEVRDNSDLKRENLPYEQYENGKEIIVIIDALDEVNGKTQEDLLETIDGYAADHPEFKMVLSCRSNYRSNSRLQLFTELFLEDLDREDIQNEINRKLGKNNRLFDKIAEYQLFDFAKNPFYLKVLIETYNKRKRLPKTKADIYRLFIVNCYKEKDRVSNDDFDKYVHLLERIALVVSLMNTQSLNKDELYKCADNEKDIEQCLRFDLIQCDNFRYSFKQSAIREWLVADYLYRVGIKKAKQLATHPNNHIKKEWYNIIVLWLSMYGNDNQEEISAIFGWLKDVSLELVVYIDRDMIDVTIRHEIFKAILLKYKGLGIRFSNLTTNDYKNLLSFDQSEDTVNFITKEIKESVIDTSYYADLMCLCYFMNWDDLCEPSKTRLFEVLVQKVKEELVIENTSTLTFIFFGNKFFKKTYYFEHLFEIIKTSNYYEAISSMIKLIDKAEKVEEYLDYILDKEKYLHDQQDGNSTISVSRKPIYKALSNIKSLDGIKKVLGHQFNLRHFIFDQEEYLKMMGNIINRVKSFINTEHKDITNFVIENLYSNIFNDGCDYRCNREEIRQELIKMLRDCFIDTNLRTNGRKSFDELFSSIPNNEIDKVLDNKSFFITALWITKEDVKKDFNNFASNNQLDQNKAYLYTEIPCQEIAEYAHSLYNEKYCQHIKWEEKRQKDFNDFAEYERFKQIVLTIISKLDNNTTRKQLWRHTDIYNQFAVEYIQRYINKEKDKYDFKIVELNIKNRNNYETFFANKVSAMILTTHLNHFVTTNAKERCFSYAKECILKVCNGEPPTTYLENALKLLLNKYFEIETDDLAQLLDYGDFHIALKDKDDYHTRDYYLLDYIAERVDSDYLIDNIIEKLRANLDKGYSLLSHLFAKYLIENQIKEGYSPALNYALSYDIEILAIIIKENIKISEIKVAIKGMELSNKLLCYSLFVDNNINKEWVKQQLESEFQTLEGYELKRAIKLLLRLGSLDALKYLDTHPELIKCSDEYSFNYEDSKAINYLCNIIKYIYGNHIEDRHFVLQSLFSSLEKITIKDIYSFQVVKKQLKLIVQEGGQYKFLNRFIITLEENYYASYSGTKNLDNVIFLIDSNPDNYVYISYKWEEKSTQTVDFLYYVLKTNGIKCKRDKNDCNYLDNIKDFMDEIRMAKYIIVVFSKAYLKSENCMYELSGIIENGNYKNRILPIKIDRDVKDDQFYAELVLYWQNKKEEYERRVKSIDTTMVEPIHKKINEIYTICDTLIKIKEYIDCTNMDNLENLFATAFDVIITKIRDQKCC